MSEHNTNANETVMIAADAVEPNTEEAVLIGTEHILIDGEPLCGHPAVRKNIENERYHTEAAEYPLSYSTCEICTRSYLANHGSRDAVFSALSEFDKGEWVSVRTEDGRELIGRVRYAVSDRPSPSRRVTLVLSDEPMERWVLLGGTRPFDRGAEVRVMEGGDATVTVREGDEDEETVGVEGVGPASTPPDCPDEWTADILDELSRAAGGLAYNVLTTGMDVDKFALNTVEDISEADMYALEERLKAAGFVIENVVLAEERDHTAKAFLTVRYDPEAEAETETDGGHRLVADGGEEPRETLRNASNGDRLRLRVDGEQYTVYVVTPIDYEEPDEYGGGGLHASIELDTDHHEVPSEDLPTESGTVAARTSITGRWEETTLAIWDPVIETDESGRDHIVGDEWINLGTVTDVEVLPDEDPDAETDGGHHIATDGGVEAETVVMDMVGGNFKRPNNRRIVSRETDEGVAFVEQMKCGTMNEGAETWEDISTVATVNPSEEGVEVRLGDAMVGGEADE